MALAVGERVYLNVNGGLRSDPPLFGRVDVINGNTPDVLRVNWENGANQTFASTAPSNLIEIATDPDEAAWLSRYVNHDPSAGGRGSGVVVRTWIQDPDGTPVQTALVQTEEGNYFIAPVADLRPVNAR